MSRKCKPFEVKDINHDFKEQILEGLVNNGAEINGENPYIVDLNKAGIILEASWDEISQILGIVVVKKTRLVGCGRVKREIIKEIEKARNGLFEKDLFNFELFEQ